MIRSHPDTPRQDALSPLLTRYQDAGDERAMEELVARTRPRLVAIARRIAGDASAEDLVQTAYFALLTQQRPGREIGVQAWLTACVVRRAYSQRARERRHLELAQKLEFPAPGGDPAGIVATEEEHRLLLAAVDRLPARYRDPVVLHYLQALSATEIAELLGVPRGTVLSRLRRARQLLHSRMSSRLAVALALVPLAIADAAQSLSSVTTTLAGGAFVKVKTAIVAAICLALAGGALWLVLDPASHTNGATDAPAAGTTPGAPVALGARGAGAVAQQAGASDPPATSAATAPTDPAASAPPAAEPSLDGQVVDTAGQAVPGATVTAFPMPGGKYAHQLRKEQSRTTTGDAEGRFSLPAFTDPCGVFAEASGFAAFREIWKELPAGPQEVRLVLHPAARVSGTVSGTDGKPLAGAKVWLQEPQLSRPLPREWMRLQTGVETGEDGSYSLDPLAPGTMELVAGHPQATDEQRVVTVAAGEHLTEVDFQLEHGLTVSGVVVDERGEGIAGSTIQAHADVLGATGTRRVERTGVSDHEGRFEIPGLDPGAVQLVATHEDHGDHPASYRGSTAQAGDRNVRLVLFRALAVTGRVLTPGGTPPKDGLVKAGPNLRANPWGSQSSHPSDAEVYWTRTKEDGSFELRGLPPGEHDLVALGNDHEPSAWLSVTLTLGQVPAPVELTLTAGLQIRGRVVTESGEPVPEAAIVMATERHGTLSGGSSSFGRTTETATDGSFVVSGLAADGVYRFDVRGGGWVTQPGARDRRVPPGTSDVVLTVTRGATVSGQVVDPSGAPQAASLMLEMSSPGTQSDGMGWRDQMQASAATGFTFTGVPPGHFMLAVDAEAGLLAQPVEFEIRPGATAVGGLELRLEAGTFLTGQAVDDEGHPLAGVQIMASRSGTSWMLSRYLTCMTAEDGSFSLGPLLPGEYSVGPGQVPPGYLQRNPMVSAHTGESVQVVLRRGVTLAGRVLAPGGAPATTFQLLCLASDPHPYNSREQGVSTVDGRFDLPGVPPEASILEVRASGFAVVRVSLTGMPAHGRHEVGDIILAAGFTLAGQVVDAAGRPVAGAEVILVDRALGLSVLPLAKATTGEDGAIALDNLPAGDATLAVIAGSAGHLCRPVTISTGEPARLELQLPACGAIAGRVTGADGTPRAGVSVSSYQQSEGERLPLPQSRNAVTAADGSYRLEGLVPGRHLLSVRSATGPGSAATLQVEVRAGEDAAGDLSVTD